MLRYQTSEVSSNLEYVSAAASHASKQRSNTSRRGSAQLPPPGLQHSVETPFRSVTRAGLAPLPLASAVADQHNDDAHSDLSNSPPTSPPSSVAPASEDEFTTFLLRRAARQLGVDYTPASSSGYRAVAVRGVSSSPTGRRGGVLANYESAAAGDASSMAAAPATAAAAPPLVAAGASVGDIQHMIAIRSKALGDKHPSVALLFIALGDRFVLDGQSARAEAAYATALERQEAHFGPTAPELLTTLSKMGSFYSSCDKFVQAKVAFQRAAGIADLLGGGLGDADNGESREREQRAKGERDAATLKAVLAQLRAEHKSPDRSRTLVAEGLVQVLNSAATEAARRVQPAPLTSVCEVQTDDAASLDCIREIAAKHGVGVAVSEPLPPKPVVLSAEQRARIRQPTLRTAEDLKRLLQFVQSDDCSAAARDTQRTVAAVGGGTAPTMLSPRTAAAQRGAAVLRQEVDLVLLHDRNRRTPGGFEPAAAAEREVAKLLLMESGIAR